jgi:hypothetical protein
VNHTPEQREHERILFATSPQLVADEQTHSPTAALTWAQQHMMGFIEALHPATASLSPRFAFQLRRGLSLPAVLSAVRDLVETHEALRTIYVPPPDGPGQHCVMSGELHVDIIHGPEETAATRADDATRDLAARPFRISSELPIRVAVVCAGHQPRFLAFAVSHLMVDFEGTKCVKYHFRNISAEPIAEVKTLTKIRQPRNEIEWERSPAGERAAQRAIENHERTLRAVPQTMLPRTSTEAEQPRFPYVTLESPALAMAVPSLARRLNTSGTAVLYAGIASVTGYLSGLPRALLQLTVGNRIQERSRHAVSMFTQDVPAFVDLGDATVADVIGRANSAILQTARFGQYPPLGMAAARAAVELDRGVAIDLSCWLNHRLTSSRPGTIAERPSRHVLSHLKDRTQWRWAGADERSTSTYFIHVDESARAVTLTMLFDTAVILRDEAIAWLRSVESLLCAAAVSDVAVADIGEHVSVTPTVFAAEWCMSDFTWAHLPTVAALVRTVARTSAADVFPVPTRNGVRLVAYLVEPSGIPITRLHSCCTSALPGCRTAMTPHWYVFCTDAPRLRDLDGWRGCRVVDQGSGRPTSDQASVPAATGIA